MIYKLIRIGLMLILMFNMSVTFCHSYNRDIQNNQIVKLDNGCKLILDSTIINKTDSISIEIIAKIKDIIPKIEALIPADSVTINLKISKHVVPVWGVGGNATGDHSIDYTYDPNHENFRVEYIVCGLIHEFMHVSRLRMPNWELTLLECMITEGLADHFSDEVLGCNRPPWTMALTKEQIKETLIKSQSALYLRHGNWDHEFNEKFFNPWMFGRNGDDPIPAWSGYSIGWELVENYIKNHPHTKASDLVWVSAKEFKDSMIELKSGK